MKATIKRAFTLADLSVPLILVNTNAAGFYNPPPTGIRNNWVDKLAAHITFTGIALGALALPAGALLAMLPARKREL